MDRRSALKKIGAGGLVAAGASMIVSTPAFAYDLPTGVLPAAMTVTPSGGDVAVNIQPGSASCPNSAPSQTATLVAISSTVTEVNTVDGLFLGFILLPTRFRIGANLFPQTVAGSPFVVRKTFNFNLGTPFAAGDSFRAEITVTWRCTYSDGTTRDRAITTNRTATLTGAGWAIT
jgi:hypothetical protein